MILAKCYSGAVTGVEATAVEIEVNAHTAEMPHFTIVGLPDVAVREAKDRVLNAILHSGFNPKFNLYVTVNLAPADTKKEGSLFDLPIAIGVLAASEQLFSKSYKDYVILGELSLDGKLRPMSGLMAILISGMYGTFFT